MVWVYLEELTDEKVTYRYYPDGGEEYGIVSLMRKTGKRIHDKSCPNYTSMFARHAWELLENFQEAGEFPEKAMIGWY